MDGVRNREKEFNIPSFNSVATLLELKALSRSYVVSLPIKKTVLSLFLALLQMFSSSSGTLSWLYNTTYVLNVCVCLRTCVKRLLFAAKPRIPQENGVRSLCLCESFQSSGKVFRLSGFP